MLGSSDWCSIGLKADMKNHQALALQTSGQATILVPDIFVRGLDQKEPPRCTQARVEIERMTASRAGKQQRACQLYVHLTDDGTRLHFQLPRT